MKKTITYLASFYVVALTSAASAQVIMSDDFNYANLGAMQANWGSNSGLGLNSVDGNPTPSGSHDGSAQAHTWVGSPISVTPTDANPLVLTGDIWYSGNNNQRNTIGLRTGANPLFEVGFFNSGNNGLGFRVVAFAGNESWVQVLPYTTLGTGAANAKWIRVEATFTGNAVSVAYDLDANGSIDATGSSTGAGYGNPFTDLRFGGPSAVLSAGGGFLVDNISLEVVPVPEPSTVAFSILGGLVLAIGVIRRRSRI